VPRAATDGVGEVQQMDTLGFGRGTHRLLTQETLRVPKVSVYGVSEGESLDVCLVDI